MSPAQTDNQWLVLLFQFPKGAGSLRVKIWRRLQSIGAIAIKNSVYLLPNNEEAQEDFEWLLAELTEAGADAALLESRFITGMDDQAVRELFNEARDRDYAALVDDIESAGHALTETKTGDGDGVGVTRQALARARKRLTEIEAMDFFGAPGHDQALGVLRAFEERVKSSEQSPQETKQNMTEASAEKLKNRVWVTRRRVGVDRIASAWLIRRWIDPGASFKFVAGKGHKPASNEIRFDMFDAEFTHQGEQCTFEVLANMVAAEDDALRAVGEIVHDIDLKDGKFARPETGGIASLISGLVASLDDDEQRIDRGSTLFESLYAHFRNPSN